MLRTYRRAQHLWAADLDIYGLSAEFGLIPGTQPIPLYNRTMSVERAAHLRPETIERFAAMMARGYLDVCLGLSHRYFAALKGWEWCVPESMRISITYGGIGAKRGQLRAGLHGEEWDDGERRPHA